MKFFLNSFVGTLGAVLIVLFAVALSPIDAQEFEEEDEELFFYEEETRGGK